MKLSQHDGEFAFKRLIVFLFIVSIGCLISANCPIEIIIDNNFLNIPLTIFPVLFGFCITVITVVGSLDATMSILEWEDLSYYHDTFKHKLVRLSTLSIIYGIITVCALFLRIGLIKTGCIYSNIIAKTMLALSVIALGYSFMMPVWLYSLYCERYEILMRSKESVKK